MRLVRIRRPSAASGPRCTPGSSPRTTPPRCSPRTRGCASRCGRGTTDRGEITTAQPAKSSSASSSARSVSTSRSFVGSSSSSTLPPLISVFARCRRLRSPPDRSPTFFCWSVPRKLKLRQVRARVDLALADHDLVAPAGDLLPRRLVRVERAPLVDVRELHRLADLELAAVRRLARRRSCGTASSCRRRSARSRRRCRRAAARTSDRRTAACRRTPSSGPSRSRRRCRAAAAAGSTISFCDTFSLRVLARQLLVLLDARLASSPAARAAPCAPTRARAAACAGAPTRVFSSCASRSRFCSSQPE